jgi:hypothetical protein
MLIDAFKEFLIKISIQKTNKENNLEIVEALMNSYSFKESKKWVKILSSLKSGQLPS